MRSNGTHAVCEKRLYANGRFNNGRQLLPVKPLVTQAHVRRIPSRAYPGRALRKPPPPAARPVPLNERDPPPQASARPRSAGRPGLCQSRFNRELPLLRFGRDQYDPAHPACPPMPFAHRLRAPSAHRSQASRTAPSDATVARKARFQAKNRAFRATQASCKKNACGAHTAPHAPHHTSLTSLNTRSFSPFRKWTMFSQLRRSKSSMAVVE